jgi:putative serine protease PepD
MRDMRLRPGGNNRVIAPAASGGSLTVLFSDGKTAAATLVGRDPLTDLAVIKVSETGLTAIPIGSSGSLVVGPSLSSPSARRLACRPP